MTRQEEIERVHAGGIHVVILGAGASLASTKRNPEKNGKALPLMNNIVDIVGLNDIVEKLPDHIKSLKNTFEQLFSVLYETKGFEKICKEIETRIYEYFKALELPDEPTIYDYLILSLRHRKDVIATFNWDPFLYQAYVRNGKFTKSPGILFLHGTVALGFNKFDGTSGPSGWYSRKNNGYFEPTKLLYPVSKKDYASDGFIKGQWEVLSYELKQAERVTIFGYSAPNTDVEAIKLLKDAWGTPDQRNMEQFELIDVRKEDDVKKSWKGFIHSHHYDYSDSFFDSSISLHPRRSVESYHHWSMPSTPSEAFQEGNPVPQNFKTLQDLWNWFKPLIEAEEVYYKRLENDQKVSSTKKNSSKRRKKRSRKKRRMTKRQRLIRMTRRRTHRSLRRKKRS